MQLSKPSHRSPAGRSLQTPAGAFGWASMPASLMSSFASLLKRAFTSAKMVDPKKMEVATPSPGGSIPCDPLTPQEQEILEYLKWGKASSAYQSSIYRKEVAALPHLIESLNSRSSSGKNSLEPVMICRGKSSHPRSLIHVSARGELILLSIPAGSVRISCWKTWRKLQAYTTGAAYRVITQAGDLMYVLEPSRAW